MMSMAPELEKMLGFFLLLFLFMGIYIHDKRSRSAAVNILRGLFLEIANDKPFPVYFGFHA